MRKLLILLSIILLVSLASFAQETRLPEDISIVVSSEYMYSVEFSHSKPFYNYFVNHVGIQWDYDKSAAVRVTAEPWIRTMGRDGRESMNAWGATIWWLRYFNVMPDPALKPFFETGLGFALFGANMPIDAAQRLNYYISLGGGFEYETTEHVSLFAGYRFGHYSNSNQAYRNPGVNGHVFFAGARLQF